MLIIIAPTSNFMELNSRPFGSAASGPSDDSTWRRKPFQIAKSWTLKLQRYRIRAKLSSNLNDLRWQRIVHLHLRVKMEFRTSSLPGKDWKLGHLSICGLMWFAKSWVSWKTCLLWSYVGLVLCTVLCPKDESCHDEPRPRGCNRWDDSLGKLCAPRDERSREGQHRGERRGDRRSQIRL